MKRSEFDDEINSLSDLIDFCSEEGCPICDDLIDDDSRDEYISEDLESMVRDEGWRDIRSWLDNIPTGYDYWIRDQWGDWEGYDEYQYEGFADDVVEWMDEHEQWDPEDEEEETVDDAEDQMEEEEELWVEDEDQLSIDDLMVGSFSAVSAIFQELRAEEAEMDKKFNILVR